MFCIGCAVEGDKARNGRSVARLGNGELGDAAYGGGGDDGDVGNGRF